MGKAQWLAVVGLGGILAASPAANAQSRPYIGYVYPAGGRQGTTFQIRLGGQNLDDVNGVLVSGTGVQAKVTEYFKRLGNTESSLMREQLRILQKEAKDLAAKRAAAEKEAGAGKKDAAGRKDVAGKKDDAAKTDTAGRMEPAGMMEMAAKADEAAKKGPSGLDPEE
jgi:hypothetical protein